MENHFSRAWNIIFKHFTHLSAPDKVKIADTFTQAFVDLEAEYKAAHTKPSHDQVVCAEMLEQYLRVWRKSGYNKTAAQMSDLADTMMTKLAVEMRTRKLS